MSWSAIIDLALGLTLAYLVFSVAASRINEFVASKLQWRADGLERSLFALFGGDKPDPASPGITANLTPVAANDAVEALSARAVKAHPIIAAFDSQAGKGRRSSYLPSRAISAAVLDILAPPAAIALDSLRKAGVPASDTTEFLALREHPDAPRLALFVASLSDAQRTSHLRELAQLAHAVNGDVLAQAQAAVTVLPATNPARQPLLRMLTDAQGDRDAFRHKIEHWYDDAMDRLSGWYKRRVQRWIIGYGLALAVLFNVDTVNIAQTLWRAPTEQAAAAQAAATAAGKKVDMLDTSVGSLKGLNLPVGWTPAHQNPVDGHSRISSDPRRAPATIGQWLMKIVGLAITTFALSFGAPFWFDVLGKLSRVRNAGNVPAKQSA